MSFYERLKDYYLKVGQVLRGESEASSIFPNSTDIGMARERIYANFLKQHVPSKCNVYFGGFLFGEDGSESKQLDVIISTDTTPKFDFHNPEGKGKSFGPVEGCLGVASIKSMLDGNQLKDALEGIASIPPVSEEGASKSPMIKFGSYADWPYKILFAYDGLSAETILEHLNSFYKENNHIPITRKPDLIHVAGKYVIMRMKPGMEIKNQDGSTTDIQEGQFYAFHTNPDLQGILWTLENLQQYATATNHIIYKYHHIINNITGL